MTVAEKIDGFFAQYRLRKYVKGQILMLNGENSGLVYHLVKGQVKVYVITYRGEEIILNIFKPPAFFPMSLAMIDITNPYVYEAETDVELQQAPASEVVAFIKANPDVMYDLLSRLYSGVEGMLQRMSLLMGGGARNRLMYELILEARRFGTLQADGSHRLGITESGIGARAGLSRETVSREIVKLKLEGLVKISANHIIITSLAALQESLGKDH